MTDEEYLFNEEVREKKKIGRGIHKRASRKRGFKGTVKTAYDFMTRKQKRELSGKVDVYHMSEIVISYDEFKKASNEKKIELIAIYLEKYSQKELAEKWNVPLKYIYGIKSRYINKKGLKISIPSSNISIHKNEEVKITEPIQTKDIKKNLFTIQANRKELSGEEISNLLSNIALILNSDKIYDLKFIIEEVIKEKED